MLIHFRLLQVYKDNQKAIDEAVAPLKVKYDEFVDKLKAALPQQVVGGDKKTE